jgi:hypothetical protein
LGGIVGVLLTQYFEERRDIQSVQVHAFLTFEHEFLFQDPELVRIRHKFDHRKGKHPLTDEEADYYLDFFEDVGTFAKRDLVDLDLVDQLLGPDVIAAYDDADLSKYIHRCRTNVDDPGAFENFEALALRLKAMDAADRAQRGAVGNN